MPRLDLPDLGRLPSTAPPGLRQADLSALRHGLGDEAAGAKGTGGRGADRDEALSGFEAMLLQQVVDAMQKTVPGGADAPGAQLYSHLGQTALAEHIARVGGVGVRDVFHAAEGPLVAPGQASTAPSRGRPDAPLGVFGAVGASATGAVSADSAEGRLRLLRAAPTNRPTEARGHASAFSAPHPAAETSAAPDTRAPQPLSDRLPPESDPWLDGPDSDTILRAMLVDGRSRGATIAHAEDRPRRGDRAQEGTAPRQIKAQ